MSDKVLHVNEADFEAKVLQATGPVLVDYWAEWCGPCRAIAPILESVADEYSGQVTVVKVNVDDNQNIAQKYGIRGIPTLMVFKQGEVSSTKVGAVSKSQLVAWLEGSLA